MREEVLFPHAAQSQEELVQEAKAILRAHGLPETISPEEARAEILTSETPELIERYVRGDRAVVRALSWALHCAYPEGPGSTAEQRSPHPLSLETGEELAARDRLDMKLSDKAYRDAYLAGDPGVQAEVAELHKMAYPSESGSAPAPSAGAPNEEG